MNKLFLYFGVCIITFLAAGCSTLEFEEKIVIDAPPAVVFAIVTDYEAYDEVLPMLHDNVEIISDTTTGLGVSWQNTSTFKGFSNSSVWTVTQFVEDELVVMEDLEKGVGISTLKTKSLPNDQTEYSMNMVIKKMFKPFEKEFLSIFRQEMQIVKAESEKRAQSTQ